MSNNDSKNLPDSVRAHKAIAGFTMIYGPDDTLLAVPGRVRDTENPGASEWLAEAARRYNSFDAMREALAHLRHLHAESVFLCGEDDQIDVDRALARVDAALALADGQD